MFFSINNIQIIFTLLIKVIAFFVKFSLYKLGFWAFSSKLKAFSYWFKTNN